MHSVSDMALHTARSVWWVFFFLASATCSVTPCPDFCHCFNGMASCSNFKVLDLTFLPSNTATLILSQGELEEIPTAFLTRANSLTMLEIHSTSARVVRGGAFRGIGHLSFFYITNCTFDIVEPEGLSGLHQIERAHISDSVFGRVGKHGFAEIDSILELRLWNNSFDYISDEAFYKLTDILSLQMYSNNINYLGTDIFKGAVEVDDVNMFRNTFKVAKEGCFDGLSAVAIRMVLHDNDFECSCELVWMLKEEHWKSQNRCFFPGGSSRSDSLFRVVDVTKDVMCPQKPTTTESSTLTPAHLDRFNSSSEMEHPGSINTSTPLGEGAENPTYSSKAESEIESTTLMSYGSTRYSMEEEDKTTSGTYDFVEHVDFVEIFPLQEVDDSYEEPSYPDSDQTYYQKEATILPTLKFVVQSETTLYSDDQPTTSLSSTLSTDDTTFEDSDNDMDSAFKSGNEDFEDTPTSPTDEDFQKATNRAPTSGIFKSTYNGVFSTNVSSNSSLSPESSNDFNSTSVSDSLDLDEIPESFDELPESEETENKEGRLAPVVSDGFGDKTLAKAYSTSAVGMETSTEGNNSATKMSSIYLVHSLMFAALSHIGIQLLQVKIGPS